MFLSLFHLLRFLLGVMDLVLFSLLLWVASWLPRPLTHGWYPRLFWSWCRVFVRALRVDLRLHEHHVRPLPKTSIIIANHPSAFEDVGLPALFDVYSLAKHEVADWWVVGRIAQAAGTLFVERDSRESRRAAAEEIRRALAAGKSVGLYPEGGCKGKRIYDHFKYGAFDISMDSGVPIVPVFIHYEAQDRFEWKPGQTLLHKLWHIASSPNRTAHYHVYDALDPTDFTDKEAYNRYVYELYLHWQAEYLE